MYRLRHHNRLEREERTKKPKVYKMDREQRPAVIIKRSTERRDSLSFKASRKLKAKLNKLADQSATDQ